MRWSKMKTQMNYGKRQKELYKKLQINTSQRRKKGKTTPWLSKEAISIADERKDAKQ